MSYYNQNIMNRMNRNEGEPFYQNNNDNKSNNNNNLYINKKNYDNNYNVNNNMHIPNNPFQNNDYSSNIEGINKIDTNIMNNNNNIITTNPFGNTISNINENNIINKDPFSNNFPMTNKNIMNDNMINKKYINNDDNEEESPLLEELGINFDLISKRMKSVFLFYKIDHTLFENSDLSGPLIIVLSLGFILLLAGKASFSYIYLIGIVSSLSIYLLLNMMSQNSTVDLYRTISMLGYALLPLVILSLISIIINLRSKKGYCISFFCILWSALTASRFFEVALRMNSQRYLVAYPIFLLYSCFALIIIF
ncbi:Yip1 protein, putative [Plasmodium reichenowi]|uniref:Protein YIPF n=1 Tax=Plasmodium reichenowi TaxID=5854 RepID=A0A060S116_PLARE|nr:Yip1 protein, putative [Plasmodium reichenowi]SOV83554.1 Yip1 protein, putative [Plasmodium reichenowi]